jgi:hypothetical protein
MNLTLTVTINGGAMPLRIQPPEWRKWEIAHSKSITDAAESLGMQDLIFLGYHAAKRLGMVGEGIDLDQWADTVEDVTSTGAAESPKAT